MSLLLQLKRFLKANIPGSLTFRIHRFEQKIMTYEEYVIIIFTPSVNY